MSSAIFVLTQHFEELLMRKQRFSQASGKDPDSQSWGAQDSAF